MPGHRKDACECDITVCTSAILLEEGTYICNQSFMPFDAVFNIYNLVTVFGIQF